LENQGTAGSKHSVSESDRCPEDHCESKKQSQHSEDEEVTKTVFQVCILLNLEHVKLQETVNIKYGPAQQKL